MEPVELPIDGVLDLHTFHPKDVPSLLPEYVHACHRRGIYHLRIIHGKGSGRLKTLVRSQLAKIPQVARWSDAPAEAGGWGATLVELTP